MVDDHLWDSRPGERSADEWKALLDGLIAALGDFLGRPVILVAHWTEAVPDYAVRSVTSKVEIDLVPALQLKAVGSVSITVEEGEGVQVCSDLMLFTSGVRLGEHREGAHGGSADVLYLTCERLPDGTAAWRYAGPIADEQREWVGMQRPGDLTTVYRKPSG